MSKPSEGKARIRVATTPGFVQIEVSDHSSKLVEKRIGALDIEVPPGVYQLRFDSSLSIEHRFLCLEAGAEFAPPPIVVKFPSAAPILGTTEYREEWAHAVERLSRNPAAFHGSGGRLVIFARDSGAPPAWSPIFDEIELRDSNGKPLSWERAEINRDQSWVGWSADVDPGSYSLRWLPPLRSTGGRSVNQALWVSPGWNTLVFLAATTFGEAKRLDRNWISVHQIRLGAGFQSFDVEAAEAQAAMELAVAGWQSRRRYLPEDSNAIDRLLNHKYFNPLLGIVAAHSLWLARMPRFDLLRSVHQTIATLVPGHPDALVLAAVAKQNRLWEGVADAPSEQTAKLEWPPVFSASWTQAVRLDWEGTKVGTGFIAPQSFAAGLAVDMLDGPVWTMWHTGTKAPPIRRSAAVGPDAAILGDWLISAIRSISLLKNVEVLLGRPLEIGDEASVWNSFVEAAKSDSLLGRLREQIETLISYGKRNGFDELRVSSLADLAKVVQLPWLALAQALVGWLNKFGSDASHQPAETVWPPRPGKGFLRSEDFGNLLFEAATDLVRKYPGRDFQSVIAAVYEWFDQKLGKNRRFINAKRFPTPDAFRAYIRTALLNAVRVVERRETTDLAALRSLGEHPRLPPDPLQEAALRESFNRLDERERQVLQALLFGDESAAALASRLGVTRSQLETILEGAANRLRLQ